jgi:hypothetical protein
VDDEALELERFEVDFRFTFGGGSLRRLVLSVGGEGDGEDRDDDGCCFVLLVEFFVGVLLALLPGVGVYESVGEGGAGMMRLGPFDGK